MTKTGLSLAQRSGTRNVAVMVKEEISRLRNGGMRMLQASGEPSAPTPHSPLQKMPRLPRNGALLTLASVCAPVLSARVPVSE